MNEKLIVVLLIGFKSKEDTMKKCRLETARTAMEQALYSCKKYPLSSKERYKRNILFSIRCAEHHKIYWEAVLKAKHYKYTEQDIIFKINKSQTDIDKFQNKLKILNLN